MEFPKKLLIGTLLANLFILVGAGHGVAPMGLVEVFTFSWIFDSGSGYNSSHSAYEQAIIPAAIASFCGMVLLLVSILGRRITVGVGGVLVMLGGFFFLTHTLLDNNIAQFSFYTGLPFLILALISLLISIRFIWVNKINNQ